MRGWGHLTKFYGVVTMQLSPHEQKAFHGMLKGWKNLAFNYWLFYAPWVLPPPILAWVWWDWAKKEHHRLERKNPKDYENES